MKRRRITRRLVEAAVIAATAATIVALGLGQGYFGSYQNGAIDRLFPSAKTDPAIIVVGMDERAFQDDRFGPPPWPRDVHARLANQLVAAGAKVIVWDVVFYSAPREGDVDALRQTADLAAALELAKDAGVTTILGVDGKLRRIDPDTGLQVLEPVNPPYATLDAAMGAGAHVKVDTADNDGVVREVPLVAETADGQFVPSLALAAVLAYRDAPIQPVLNREGVQAGGRFVPTESTHNLRLNFARGLDAQLGRRSLVSAVDVYEGTVNPDRFRDKIVFIGATAESYRDNFDTPINKSGGLPGVFIHANAANTILTASYLEVASSATTVALVALLCLLVALAVLFLPLWLSPLLTLFLIFVYLFFTAARFDNGKVMNVVYPIGLMVISFFASVMVRYFTETRHRQRVSRLFAQYVPEAVAQQLVDEGRVDQAAEGERLDVSLFFCDLRGFTAMSRSLTPQQVRAMLNEFYDALTDITLDHNGTVLKFVGDEVFAVFGAPLPVDRHPEVALDCAMAIQRAAPALTERLAEMGIPPAYFGIGMNTGEVVAAHVGGGKRRQYDIVGDTVNIGSRMCGQAGKGDIVMPKAMYDILHDPPRGESMGLVSLKNVEEPIELIRIRVDWADGPGDGLGDGDEGGSTTTEAATMGA